jgi:hypothetical protein
VLKKQQQLVICFQKFNLEYPAGKKIEFHFSGKCHVVIQNRYEMPAPDIAINENIPGKSSDDIKRTTLVAAAFKSRVANLLRLQRSYPKKAYQQ